jgi:hypothetical protein
LGIEFHNREILDTGWIYEARVVLFKRPGLLELIKPLLLLDIVRARVCVDRGGLSKSLLDGAADSGILRVAGWLHGST